MKLRVRYLEKCLAYKGNHKRYLTALRKIILTVLLKGGKTHGITAHVLKEIILEDRAAKIG
jgi:hypothetical protein